MTEEQKKARRLSAENGNIRWIKENCLRTKDDQDDYVFISYKSDDFEKVLDDIVYKTCRKYGLRVYFDTAFDENSEPWIEQYYDNMCNKKCKAFIAFIDKAYYSSYACLLEMMTRRTRAAGGDYEPNTLFFLPINLEKITDDGLDDSNTGLGTKRFSNGAINSHAQGELKKFNEIFSEVSKEDKTSKTIYKRKKDRDLYEEAMGDVRAHGKMYLNVTQCRKLMELFIPKANDNDGGNKAFEDVIHDKLVNAHIDTVFAPNWSANSKNHVTVDMEKERKLGEPDIADKKDALSFDMDECNGVDHTEIMDTLKLGKEAGHISLQDFLKKYDNNTFKKNTFSEFRLVGAGELERYSTDWYDSAFMLTWNFVMKLLSERGIDFIDDVKRRHADLKNPVFITSDEYKTRDDQFRYRQVEVKGLEHYYMYRHYNPYQWVGSALKPRLIEYGLPIEQFSFEYKIGLDEAVEKKPQTENQYQQKVMSVAEITTSSRIGKSVVRSGEGEVQRIEGQFPLRKFLEEYNNKTFQSKSCKYIKLLGINGCEKYSIEFDENGQKIQTARQLVFLFAMKRLDEMGMKYIHLVNAANISKNPIFITVEEHNARKARKESVTYTKVTSKAVSGYSMCTHYSEYDWLKNSFLKQINALELSEADFIIVCEI